MTKEHIEVLCTLPSWHAASSILRGAFAYEMEGRQYGREALLDAWEWFQLGWIATGNEED